MYDLVDRPVSVLPVGSRYVLWAMRGWVAALAKGACPPAKLAPAFLKMAVIEALPHFHVAMSALNGDAREMLNFYCMHRPEISESEAVLLRLWNGVAAGQDANTLKLLELLVKAEAVPVVFSAMRTAIPALRRAGLEPLIASTQTIGGDGE